MRPIRKTVSAAAVSAPIPLDHYISPFNVGLGVSFSAGAAMTYSVEHTFDDIWKADFDPATATWYLNSGLTAKTASLDGNYLFPVTAVRLNVTAHTSGSATLTVIQAGGGV